MPSKRPPQRTAGLPKGATTRGTGSETNEPKAAKRSQGTKRRVRNPDLAKLRSLQLQFVIAVPARKSKDFVSGLRRFIPENTEFWNSLNASGKSREDYENKLLDPKTIATRAAAINRGARLVYSAASWDRPSVGPKEKASASRGQQWRAAMAWVGAELLFDSLFPRGYGSAAEAISEWCRLLGCGDLESAIAVPGGFRNSTTVRGLWQEELEILDFLGIRDGKPRTILNNWWGHRKPVGTYVDAMMVARSLRDITLHGLMSANRVQRFGLSKLDAKTGLSIFDRLVDTILRVVVLSLETLLRRDQSPDRPRRTS